MKSENGYTTAQTREHPNSLEERGEDHLMDLVFQYTNPSLLTGNSTRIKTLYKKKHSPSLGIQNQDQKVSSP